MSLWNKCCKALWLQVCEALWSNCKMDVVKQIETFPVWEIWTCFTHRTAKYSAVIILFCLALSLPSSKSTFSHISICDLARIGHIIIFIWVSCEKPSSSYCVWCNISVEAAEELKFITLGSERWINRMCKGHTNQHWICQYSVRFMWSILMCPWPLSCSFSSFRHYSDHFFNPGSLFSKYGQWISCRVSSICWVVHCMNKLDVCY